MTTREKTADPTSLQKMQRSPDHAELARLADWHRVEARKTSSGYPESGFHKSSANAIEALLSEIAALKGERDEWRETVRFNERCWSEDRGVMIDRFTQAERQRDELRSEGQKFADFIIQINAPDQGECLTEDERLMFAVASKFRAFLATQGADQ